MSVANDCGREQRINEFSKLGIGLFIHYGLYSLIGRGEWSWKLNNIDDKDYKKTIDKFDAKNFNAEEIVLLAKNNGFKYITFTARHHDGFSLYDTKGLSSFDTMHSPCKRDLVRELSDACHKHGIKLIIYHTTLDWYQESFKNDFKKYLIYLRESIELLCKNYGEIGGFWFDGNWAQTSEDWEEDKLYSLIRKYQPNAIITNNTGLSCQGELGHEQIDSVTFERGKPFDTRTLYKRVIMGEACQVINDHWGYSDQDINYKGIKELIFDLIDCRKCGANFLLNISPNGDGSFGNIEKGILEKIGLWLNINKKAIYDVKPSLVNCENELCCLLEKESRLYLFIKNIPMLSDSNVALSGILSDDITITGIKNKIKSITWLDDGSETNFIQNGDKAMISAKAFEYGRSLIVRVAELKF